MRRSAGARLCLSRAGVAQSAERLLAKPTVSPSSADTVVPKRARLCVRLANFERRERGPIQRSARPVPSHVWVASSFVESVGLEELRRLADPLSPDGDRVADSRPEGTVPVTISRMNSVTVGTSLELDDVECAFQLGLELVLSSGGDQPSSLGRRGRDGGHIPDRSSRQVPMLSPSGNPSAPESTTWSGSVAIGANSQSPELTRHTPRSRS